MKSLLQIILVLSCGELLGQTFESERYEYLELRASVDALGNIYINPLAIKKIKKSDSLYIAEINNTIKISNKALDVLNNLSSNGWNLVTVTNISMDNQSRPNTPFVLYYLKRQKRN
jgi:hypothetical protein